jgi:DNA-directed RNA polymerase subunit RPC12/RpoP
MTGDDLPAVVQSEPVKTVNTTFVEGGPHRPLPFPDAQETGMSKCVTCGADLDDLHEKMGLACCGPCKDRHIAELEADREKLIGWLVDQCEELDGDYQSYWYWHPREIEWKTRNECEAAIRDAIQSPKPRP